MIKVYIDNAPYQIGSRIWIIETENDKRFILRCKGDHWSRDAVTDGVNEEPSLMFPHHIEQEVFKALIDAISNKGIKPDSYALIEGEMKATRLHLDDMRKLVFNEARSNKKEGE